MARKIDPENVADGVDKAMWAWVLEHRDVTLPTCVENGVERALTQWLEAHKAEIIEKIAEKVAKQRGTDGPGQQPPN